MISLQEQIKSRKGDNESIRMDIKLYYREQGTGKSMILLHGNGENSGYFEHQITYFSEKYRVIAIDTRGHGMSERGDKPFTIGQFAEDLHDFMDQHQIEKAIILGFSDGGNIALKFAVKYGKRVEALIVDGANLDPGGVKISEQLPVEFEYRLARFSVRKTPESRKKAELLGLMVNDPFIKTSDLQKIIVPTLVLAGTKDMIKEKHTRFIAENILDAKLALIPGTHFIARDNSGEFNAAVDKFLNSLKDQEGKRTKCKIIKGR